MFVSAADAYVSDAEERVGASGERAGRRHLGVVVYLELSDLGVGVLGQTRVVAGNTARAPVRRPRAHAALQQAREQVTGQQATRYRSQVIRSACHTSAGHRSYVSYHRPHVTGHRSTHRRPRAHAALQQSRSHATRQNVTLQQVTGHASQVTRHRSRFTGHRSIYKRSSDTRHRAYVTRHSSHVTGHTSQATRHRSHVTGYTSQVTRQLTDAHKSTRPCSGTRHRAQATGQLTDDASLQRHTSQGIRHTSAGHRSAGITASCNRLKPVAVSF